MATSFNITPLTLQPNSPVNVVEVSSTQIYLGVSSVTFANNSAFPNDTELSPYYPNSQAANLFVSTVVNGVVGPAVFYGILSPSGTSPIYSTLVTGLSPATTYQFDLRIQTQIVNTQLAVVGTYDQDVTLGPITTQVALNYSTTFVASSTNAQIAISPNPWNPGGNPWNSTPSDYTGYTYQWYRSQTNGFTPGPSTVLSGQTSINIVDTTVSGNSTYFYIGSISDGHTTVYSPQVAVTTLANLSCNAPTILSFNASNVTAQTSGVAGGVPPYIGYQWYRSTSSGFTPGPSNILVGQTSTTLVDGTVSSDTLYYYKYTVLDSVSNTVTSAQSSVNTQTAVTLPTPTQTSITSTTVVLTDSGASGGSGSGYSYQWYRSTIPNFSPSAGTALTGQVNLSFIDFGLLPVQTYYYVLSVVDSSGNSAISSELQVTTLPGQLSIGYLNLIGVSSSSVTVQAPFPTGGVPPYTYSWFVSQTAGQLGTNLGFSTQAITDTGAWIVGGLLANSTYFYTCIITDAASPSPDTVNSVQLAATTSQINNLGSYYANLLIYQYAGNPMPTLPSKTLLKL